MNRDFFDNYYSSQNLYYGREVRPEFSSFLEQSRIPESCRVLDLGCGDGRYAIYLAEKGFRVHSIDRSPVGLSKLASYAEKYGLEITTKEADLNTETLPAEEYDLIIFATVLDHLQKRGRDHLIREIISALKPGGYFYGDVFTRQDPGYYLQQGKKPRQKVSETAGAVKHYFAPGELRNCFASQEILEYKEFREEDLKHGRPHLHGWACILGRKPGNFSQKR